ncbi:MAG: hypothetical protein RL069_1820, partial [Planctomycetota bacterium]
MANMIAIRANFRARARTRTRKTGLVWFHSEVARVLTERHTTT